MRFADKVYSLTAKIPRGKVTTYGEIARALTTKGYRAVGQALHTNPHAPRVPCHRVVNSDGSLGGFASGTTNKKKMLQQEGVVITNGKINLHHHFYQLKKKRGA